MDAMFKDKAFDKDSGSAFFKQAIDGFAGVEDGKAKKEDVMKFVDEHIKK